MVCPLITRTLCHAARDHYIKTNLPKYVKTLMDPEYQQIVKITSLDAKREVQKLMTMCVELQKYDEIDKHGRRVPRKKNLFGNMFQS